MVIHKPTRKRPVPVALPVRQDRMIDAFFGSDTLSIREAGVLLGLTPRTIRLAIRAGKLKAFVVGGRIPERSGAGMGYRIHKADLQAWYFGADTLPTPKEDPDVRP